MNLNLWGLLKREGPNSVDPNTTVWAGVYKEEGSDLWSLLERQNQTEHEGLVEVPLWEAGF